MAQGQIGSGLLQVGISGVEPKQASGLAQDISNLFGSVAKGVETYNTIGETAAKLEFQSQSLDYQNKVTAIKRGLKDNPDVENWKQSRQAIEELSADFVSVADKSFTGQKAAYDVYRNYSLEHASNTMASLDPMLTNGMNEAVKKQTKETTILNSVTLGASATKENIETDILINKEARTELDVPNEYLSKNLSSFDSAFNSNPAFFVKTYYLDKDGNVNQKLGDEKLINSYYSAFAKLNKNGILEKANSFVTDEHLEAISQSIAKAHSMFKSKEDGSRYSPELAASTSSADNVISQLRSGSIDLSTVRGSVNTAKDNMNTYFSLGGDGQKNQVNTTKVKLDAALEYNLFANSQVTSAISKGGKNLSSLVKNGYKDYQYTASGVSYKEDIPKDVFIKILEQNVASLDKSLYDENGKVNYTALSDIVSITNNAGTTIQSAAVEGVLSGVFNSGVSSAQSVGGFLQDISIARYALKNKKTPYTNINIETINAGYLDRLEAQLKTKIDSKNPQVDIANAKAVVATQMRGLKSVSETSQALFASARSKVMSDPSILNTKAKLGSATVFTTNDTNINTWTKRRATYAGYQPSDASRFGDEIQDVITNDDNSYFFQSSASPTAQIKYVPKAYDETHVPVNQERFNMAIANKNGFYDTYKNVIDSWDSFKDDKGRTVRLLDLSQPNVDVEVIDGTKGSITTVTVYPKNRTKASKPIGAPVIIRSDEFNKYPSKLPLGKAFQRWFRPYELF